MPGRELLVKQGFRHFSALLMSAAVLCISAGPAPAFQEVTIPGTTAMQTSVAEKEDVVSRTSKARFGTASWYSKSDPSIKRRTASGEIFNDKKMTCASWSYPFKTRLRITNLANGKSVVCVVNDRGPAKRLGRIVDLTRSAFARISDLKKGLLTVSITPLTD